MRSLNFRPLNQNSGQLQWASLLALSGLFVSIAAWAGLPGAFLFGTVLAAILVGVAECSVRVTAAPFLAAQGVIGCLVGQSIPITILGDLVRGGPVYFAGVFAVIAVASALGLVLTHWRLLPGTTAIWGTSPGASTPMILMSEAYGGDIRLVAVMQYLRLVCVVLAATIVSSLWGASPATVAVNVPATVWFPPLAWGPFLTALAIAFGGSFLANWARLPAGAMLLPLVAVMLLRETGLTIQLPPWLLVASYAIIGWSIGLRFTRPILLHALRVLPTILAATFALIAFCGGIAMALVKFAGIDPLTAYLATSPGGLDSVAIIAASSPADLRFVMAMQTSRLIVALLVSPGIARYMARRQAGLGARP